MGWMLRDYPAAEPNFKNAPDLLNDKLVMFQHKYYIPLVIAVHVGILVPIGWAVGDIWGRVVIRRFNASDFKPPCYFLY